MIGKTITIRGELSGDHDVVVDGRLEGRINLTKSLTVGKNGTVDADVSAHTVSVAGRFTGNVSAEQRVEIDATASLTGNVTTPRLSIADGAFFKGSVDMESKPTKITVADTPEQPA
jgi:cytoskeletal protein CcmA (bactofilin family)